MASFGKDVDGFSASRSIKIIGTETVDSYTVSHNILGIIIILNHVHFNMNILVICLLNCK